MLKYVMIALVAICLASMVLAETQSFTLVKDSLSIADSTSHFAKYDTSKVINLFTPRYPCANRIFRTVRMVTDSCIGDSVTVWWQYSQDGERWRQFDTVAFQFATSGVALNDTMVTPTIASLDLDSVTLSTAEFMRAIVKYHVTFVAADTPWVDKHKSKKMKINLIYNWRMSTTDSADVGK